MSSQGTGERRATPRRTDVVVLVVETSARREFNRTPLTRAARRPPIGFIKKERGKKYRAIGNLSFDYR